MSWELMIGSLFALVTVFTIGAIIQGKNIDGNHLLRSYLLAGNTLQKYRIINLLWSTSFSLNGMLYQIWLGYLIGAWALVTQGAWAISYIWLAKYSTNISQNDSIHQALGSKYHPSSRRIAGILSIIGVMAMIGWEYNVGRSTFEGLLSYSPPENSYLSSIIVSAAMFSIILYTIIGGMRGNAFADLIQSVLKMIGFIGIIILLIFQIVKNSFFDWSLAFPNISVFIEKIGWFGLVTNVAFSLVWQFVDMSTWQTVISGSKNNSDSEVKSNLKWSSFLVFLAPGIIGTILGILLYPAQNVTDSNVISKALEIISSINPITSFIIIVALFSCLMSMVDGLLIASGYALIIDVLKPGKSLDELDSDSAKSKRLLGNVRLTFILMGITGVYGINYFMEFLDLSVFNLLYIVIIPQLSLTGPVFMYLFGRSQSNIPMWSSMIFASVVGVCMVASGIQWMNEGAGFFTTIVSVVLAFIITKKQ